MLFTLTVKSLLPQGSIIQSLACAIYKDRFNYLPFNHSLEFFTTTWLEMIISQGNFVTTYSSIMQLCYDFSCKKAKLQARIKLTALCSAIDKENSIEFSLDLLYYIYNYYYGYAPCLPQSSYYLSADFSITCCDLWLCVIWPLCDSVTVTWYFPCSTLVIIVRGYP